MFRGWCGALTGTVEDLGPMPNPKANRAMNMCHQVFVKACQKQARAEKVQVRKIVPRRPNQLLKGIVSQHPMKAQHKYLNQVNGIDGKW